jgi:hypothetical protein
LEDELPSGRFQVSGDHVENGGFPCAVWTDQSHEVSLFKFQGEIGHGHQATEDHTEMFCRKKSHFQIQESRIKNQNHISECKYSKANIEISSEPKLKNDARIQERFLPLIVRILAARMLEISVISFNKFSAT